MKRAFRQFKKVGDCEIKFIYCHGFHCFFFFQDTTFEDPDEETIVDNDGNQCTTKLRDRDEALKGSAGCDDNDDDEDEDLDDDDSEDDEEDDEDEEEVEESDSEIDELGKEVEQVI